ncbi:MAG: PAS domain-containing sensor histidine kinase, partial [Gemmatimonas sp.]
TKPLASLPLTDAMLAEMVAISADAIIAVDSAQTIVLFNAGAEQTFGYSAAEAIGLSLNELLPERFRHVHRDHLRRFGAAHEPARRMGERRQISGLRRNGEEFPAEASIARVALDDREVYTVVLRDITARQKIEHELRLALESRDQMAGIVSHDLRNPVSAVKMLASAILQRDANEAVAPEVAVQLAVIRLAAEQMDALIEDLADITRIESGRLRVHCLPIDPITLVDLACDTLYPLAESKSQTIELEFGSALPTIMADADRIVQVFSNVIGNAIKFTPVGGTVHVSAALKAEARNRPEHRELVFAVSDTGPGIVAQHLPHVFNRYWQSASSVRAGSGLGLTIAKGIVEAHDGWIDVESVEGHGTTVRFALPCVDDNECVD